jgi:hypothetical protein
MSNTGAGPWEWLFRGRYDGLTLTFTRGLTPAGLLERYGADPSAARPLPFTDIRAVLQPDMDHAILRAGVLGEWAFGIEDAGAQGAAPATLAQLSRGTETISVYRGGNAFTVFCHWVSGQPREQFEPGMASTLRAAGPHPFWDAAERHRAAQPGIRPILAVMRAVENHIGASLAQETDDGRLPSVLLTQIRPPLPSPVPLLPLVNSPASPGRLSRHLGTLRLPERPRLRAREPAAQISCLRRVRSPRLEGVLSTNFNQSPRVVQAVLLVGAGVQELVDVPPDEVRCPRRRQDGVRPGHVPGRVRPPDRAEHLAVLPRQEVFRVEVRRDDVPDPRFLEHGLEQDPLRPDRHRLHRSAP